jgi:Zn-dependent M28 family amino/carboxypeptidase
MAATLVAACSSATPAAPTDLARDMAGKITLDAMYTHLRQLQDIADANDGNRAEGRRGYDASVDYVAQMLQNKGFEVQTPEFERLGMTRSGNPRLTIAGRGYPVDQASLMQPTTPGGLGAVTLRPAKRAGCNPADYGTMDIAGAIAVVDDTGCSVVDKHNVAVGRGAVGLLVVSAPGTEGSPPALFPPGYFRQLRVPVGVIGRDADAALRRTTAPVRLTLDEQAVMVKSRNILAQTKTGDTSNVVVVGAHLDSVAGGPGLNDNGSGVAAVLETAAALGAQPQLTNAVRFVFWGSEEAGLAGSAEYVRGLTRDELNDIALYLNFDMLASPNPGFFTYDGDQSAQPGPDVPSRDVPVGSAGDRATPGRLSEPGRGAAGGLAAW